MSPKSSAKPAVKIVAKTAAKPAGPAFPTAAPAEAAFTITASQPGRPPRALKSGDTFVVLDSRGDIGASSGGSAGLFHQDTRHLARLELLVNDAPPLLLGSNLRDDNSAFIVDLTNPDLMAGERMILPTCSRSAARIALRGHSTTKLRGADQVLLVYHGLDARVRRTALSFDPQPDRLATDSAIYDLHLEPGEMRPTFLAVSCDETATRPPPFLRGLIAARREMREQARERTSVEASNDRFNEILCRSAADLAMLMTDTPQGRYPYAGIPWYATTFGRDGLITALQMLWWSPEVARGVLRRLAAAYQAKTSSPACRRPWPRSSPGRTAPAGRSERAGRSRRLRIRICPCRRSRR